MKKQKDSQKVRRKKRRLKQKKTRRADREKLRSKTTYSIKWKDLLLNLGQLKQWHDLESTMIEKDVVGYLQLGHLVRSVETEFCNSATMHERMKGSGRVSFDMLWTFLKPGEKGVCKCVISEEPVCGKIQKATYKQNDPHPPKWCLQLKLTTYNYN
ncbi:hypothetical protein R1flu_016537 [Riccia fluitans]|uniref:DUF7025 domain-containing protein n=1 Tax=Riccia fluitans TaxID=41844 RepID=A0ABD1YMM4_9MARC